MGKLTIAAMALFFLGAAAGDAGIVAAGGPQGPAGGPLGPAGGPPMPLGWPQGPAGRPMGPAGGPQGPAGGPQGPAGGRPGAAGRAAGTAIWRGERECKVKNTESCNKIMEKVWTECPLQSPNWPCWSSTEDEFKMCRPECTSSIATSRFPQPTSQLGTLSSPLILE